MLHMRASVRYCTALQKKYNMQTILQTILCKFGRKSVYLLCKQGLWCLDRCKKTAGVTLLSYCFPHSKQTVSLLSQLLLCTVCLQHFPTVLVYCMSIIELDTWCPFPVTDGFLPAFLHCSDTNPVAFPLNIRCSALYHHVALLEQYCSDCFFEC